MSIPQPPDGIYSHLLIYKIEDFNQFLDPETRNIVEKLASFVARMFSIFISYLISSFSFNIKYQAMVQNLK
jgi:hypothetical protein